MGEESIRRPPESKKARITCAQASRAIVSLPTLKVIQLPSPTRAALRPSKDRLAEHASLLRRRELRAEQRGRSGGGQGAQQPAATEW